MSGKRICLCLIASLVLASTLARGGAWGQTQTAPDAKDKPPLSVPALIDKLTETAQGDIGYMATMSGTGFLPLGQSEMGTMMLFQQRPLRSDTMRELVKQGRTALPHLIAHIDDKRPTKVTISHGFGIGGMLFVDEYDYNRRTLANRPKGINRSWTNLEEKHPNTHTVTVGDLCFVALGQIVNRSFAAVRYQPTACIMVNSPTYSEALRRTIIQEWGGITPEQHKASLIRDFLEPDHAWRRAQAALRLAYYYPDALEPLVLKQLARPYYDSSDIHSFVHKKVYPAKDANKRRALFDAYVAKHGEAARDGLLQQLFFDLDVQEDNEEGRRYPRGEKVPDARECLVDLYGKPKDVKSTDPHFIDTPSASEQAGFISSLVYDRSAKIDRAVRDLMEVTSDDYLALNCMYRLVGRGYDADIERHIRARRPRLPENSQKECTQLLDKLGWTWLHVTVDLGVPEMVEKALSEKGDINTRARNGQTPLHLAAAHGDLDIVEMLITATPKLNIRNEQALLPVQLAARDDHKDIVRLLVAKGSDVPDVLVAATAGATEKLKALLKADPAQVKGKNNAGYTPLLLATRVGSAASTQALLDAGAEVDITDKDRWTSLHYAAWLGHDDVAKVLLAHGADVEARAAGNGFQPLHLAVYAGRRTVAETLLKHNADVNARDRGQRFTPLHWAVDRGHLDLVALLLAHKADRQARDENDNTPLDIAKEKGNMGILKLLRE
jgi:ankyrin repeat protein